MFVYGTVMASATLILAVVCFSYTNDGSTLTESQKLRLLLLGAGVADRPRHGAARVRPAVHLGEYREIWGKGLQSWRDSPKALLWPGLALLGGLALMFASVQLGRGLERENQGVRRLIYGFNAVLMTLLLLAILAIPNVLAYAQPFTRFFGRPFDWTSTDVNAISPALRNLLGDLKEPVKVYVMMPSGTIVTADSQTLLDNCRSLSSNFSWELIDPRFPANRTRIVGFMEKYAITDPMGMLIIRGVESEKSKSDHASVKFRDLYSQDPSGGMRGPLTYSFLGENALYQALIELIEGKLVLYFTQGHGEMSLGSAQPAMPRMRRGQGGDLSVLKGRLTERKNVEVKSLTVDRALKKVPDDANVVVVVRPTDPFSAAEAKVLRDYVKRPAKTRKVKDKDGPEREEEEVTAGKLMLLFNPVIAEAGRQSDVIARTGLESLLAEYNVKLGNDRILTLTRRDPLEVVAVTSPHLAQPDCQGVPSGPDLQTRLRIPQRPHGRADGRASRARHGVERLLLVPTQFGFWAETNLEPCSEDRCAGLPGPEGPMKKGQAVLERRAVHGGGSLGVGRRRPARHGPRQG